MTTTSNYFLRTSATTTYACFVEARKPSYSARMVATSFSVMTASSGGVVWCGGDTWERFFCVCVRM